MGRKKKTEEKKSKGGLYSITRNDDLIGVGLTYEQAETIVSERQAVNPKNVYEIVSE